MRAVERLRNTLAFTLSSILRRKGKNLILMAVYTFVIFILASVMFFTNSIKREAVAILAEAPEMMVQKLVAGRQDLILETSADEIRKIKGVQSAKARLWGYYYDPSTAAAYTLMAEHESNDDAGSVILGEKAAKALRVGEGGTISFRTYDGKALPLKVKSLLRSESELMSSDLIMISETDFRRLFNIPEGFATDLVLRVRNSKELPTIAAKITQIFPDARPIMRDELLRTYDAVFAWRGGLVILILSSGIFAFIILAWDKATGLSAEEKKEVGILKAVGWETSDVLLMKFWEGAAISLSCFALGLLLAYLHVFLASSTIFAPALEGWSVLYPGFKLTPVVDTENIATLFFLTVFPYTVATIVPSWRAAIIEPDSIMRG